MTTTSVDLNDPFPLQADEIEAFERDGFIKLKNVLSRDIIKRFRPLLREVTMKHNELADIPLSERNTYQRAFIQVTNLWKKDEQTIPLVFSKRLAGIAAQLLRVSGVRLWHDQALYKERGGGFTPWHADQYYWPLATDRSVTVWIPLQETPLEMGPLEFARGSQHFTGGRHLEISDDSETRLREMIDQQQFDVDRGPFELGEVSYHLGWTYHHTGPNETDCCREVMTIIYMDKEMKLARPTNRHQEVDWSTWAPGAEVGGLIASPLNPVLYP